MNAAIVVGTFAAVCLSMTAPTSAQNYEFVIDSNQSAIARTAALSVPFAGTFIGDFDPVDNPTGTQTRPGFFGGSGNQPIDYSATLIGDGEVASAPAGTFSLDVDLDSLSASIDNLSLDLLNGAPASFAATLEIGFDTFHTVNPIALFIGGFTLPIPLGEVTVSSITATQIDGPAAAVLVPLGRDSYSFAAVVNAEIVIEASFLGEPIGGTPTIVPLPVGGTLTIGRDGAATVEIAIDAAIDESVDPKLEPFTDIPLDVPTILPPGETAHLLLSGTIESVSLQLTLSSTIIAAGEPALTPGDLDGDGDVDGADLGILLLAWGKCLEVGPQGCAADLNDDGLIDGADLGILLLNWTG